MRRKDREIDREETVEALKKGTWGVISVSVDGEPYGVPVNYYYSSEENAIFFHCAKEGRKLDGITYNSRVSFTVVLSEKIIPEKFSTLYESVIVSGRASLVKDKEETAKRLRELCDVLAPGMDADGMINQCTSAAMVRIDIENMSGKKHM